MPAYIRVPCLIVFIEFADYEAQFKDLTKVLEEKNNALKTAENQLKLLTSTPTTDAAIVQTKETKLRIEALEMKLEGLRTSTAVLSADDKKALLDEHSKHLKEYR